MNKILIVDDEKNQRDILEYILKKEGFETISASSAEEALVYFSNNEIDVVLSDLLLPKMDGLGLLGVIMAVSPDTSVVIITGHGSIDSAVTAIKQGAFDYITKPLRKEHVIAVARKALERTGLLKERKYLYSRLNTQKEFEGNIGEHPLFKNVIKMVFKIAPFDATVLITGESGTGKEIVSRAIHNISPRKEKPFIAVNSAALPENLIESELFGYMPGAFTGAASRKRGLFEAADGGTLFLDEIADLPLNTQAKLLRVLQNKEVLPLGATSPVKIDVRIITATNSTLEEIVKTGRFRADLYYRLNVFSLRLPPLRERSSDIPLLVNFFLDKYRYLTAGKNKFFDSDSLKLFLDYPWHGNIRELESVVQKSLLYSDGEAIHKTDVLPLLTDASDLGMAAQNSARDAAADLPPAAVQGMPLETVEKELIIKAMEQSGWKMSKACKMLGITYRTLQYRLGKHGIKPSP